MVFRRFAFSLVVVLLSRSTPAAVFWLGGGGAPCNFSTLSTALGAVPDGATIRIANNQAYTDINLTVADLSVTLEGGWADCAGTPSGERTVLEGAAGANLPVLRAQAAGTARNVRLDHLEIRGGTHGGLEVNGLLDVRLEDTLVTANSGVNGGGIIVLGATPAQTVLRLVHSVVGTDEAGTSPGNTATAGAGVYCDHARVQLSSALIQGNVATDRGGGLSMLACTLDAAGPALAVPGYPLLSALVRDNDGGFFGGGLHARQGTTIGLDTDNQPVVFVGNSAGRGGALYLRDAGTRFDGAGITLADNHAAGFGAGAYVQDDAFLVLQRGTEGDACAPGATCSRIIDNVLDTAPTSGASAIQVSNADAVIQQTEIAGNTSANASQATFYFSGGSQVRILDSLVHDNDAGVGTLVRIDGMNNGLVVGSSTIAANTTASPLVEISGSSGTDAVFVALSIVWQPGTVAVDTVAGDALGVACVNAHPGSGLDDASDEPVFVDAAGGDWRLRLGSPDIDACTQTGLSGSTGSGTDIAGRVRPLVIGDGATPYDRGAHEFVDLIFVNGFEESGPVP